MAFISFKELKQALAVSVERKRDGGATINHGAVAVAAGGGVTKIVDSNTKRRRITLINMGTPATPPGQSECWVGAAKDIADNDLADSNGYPLFGPGWVTATFDTTVCGEKLGAVPLVLETRDAIYGFVAGGGTDADVRYIEEVD